MEFAQYQVMSIDHRRGFIPKIDNIPLRILRISGTFTSAFRIQSTKYDVTPLIEKKIEVTFFHLKAKRKAKVEVGAESLLDTFANAFSCFIKFTPY